MLFRSVNGQTLTKAQIASDVEKILAAQGGKIPTNQIAYARQMFGNQLAQSFLVENVLVAKAKAEGFAVTEADRKAREGEFLKAAANMPDAPKSVEDYFKKFPLGEARARSEFENGILIDKMLKAYQAKEPKTDYAAEAQKKIEERGGTAQTSVTSKTTLVVAGPGAGSKLDKAKKAGIPVIGEEEFLKML